jgi:hypothetical protein
MKERPKTELPSSGPLSQALSISRLQSMKKNQPQASDLESSFSKLLGQPGGPRDEPPSCAKNMGIEDGYISCHVRV